MSYDSISLPTLCIKNGRKYIKVEKKKFKPFEIMKDCEYRGIKVELKRNILFPFFF